MKTALIFAYIGIGILAFFVFKQGMDIKKLQEIPKVPVTPTPPVTSTSTTSVAAETADNTRYVQITNSKDKMSGSELWEGIQKAVKEIDIKF